MAESNRRVAIKSIIAAMKSLSKIQGEQNKLRANILENSRKAQDELFYSMEKKKQMAPFELEQKRQEKQIVGPESQARIDWLKTRQPKTEERVKAKVAESGVESLNPGERAVWGLIGKKGKKKLPTVRESKLSQKKLFKEYLGQLYAQSPETAGIEKAPFITSRRELISDVLKGKFGGYVTGKGKLNVRSLFDKLGVTLQDFQRFSQENFPEDAQSAFPELGESTGGGFGE